MEELSESLQVNLSTGSDEDQDDRESNGSNESWREHEGRRDSWVDTGPLSEELRLLDEEQKRQIEEARQWLEEEDAADEMLRRDLEELQIAEQRNHELSARLIAPEPEIPPEVQEKLVFLEKTVKSLQEQLSEKGAKLNQKNESYSELLSKFDSMTDRLVSTDQDFKQTLSRVKEEYGELEGVLRVKMKTYQDLNKQLELSLNEKEAEISGLKDKLSDYATMKESFSELQNKLDDTTKSVDHLNKMTIKLKERLKTIRLERDSLLKEKESAESVEPLKQRIAALEAEREELIEEKKAFEDVELLKNKITLLEEDKGNLQLQLVDLDEMKESAESFKLLCESLEKEKNDLTNTLENFKRENVELLNDKESTKKVAEEQESVIVKLKNALQQVTDEKIASVMRSVELEELLTSKDKEISTLRDSLRMVEAEKLETSRRAEQQVDGDSELLSDYNVSNGLTVKLTVLENELESCRERERALSVTVGELQNLRAELESKLHAANAEKDHWKRENESLASSAPSISPRESDLEVRLNEALRNLEDQTSLRSDSENKLFAALAEREKLSKALSEKETVSKKTAAPAAAAAAAAASAGSDTDATITKLKKVAAVYKKRCTEMDNEIEQLKASLSKSNDDCLALASEVEQLKASLSQRSDDCSMLASERSCLEHDVLNQASRYQQIFNEAKQLENELAELYSFVNEFKNVPVEHIAVVVNPSKVANALAALSTWSSRTGVELHPTDYVPQPSSIIDQRDVEELQQLIADKELAIQDLENEKDHLSDLVSANAEELQKLRELYEKEASKNEQFFTDLQGLEEEMTSGKSELISKLEEVTHALQSRENYIEVLEQDIVNMKTKMFSIESGMDDRHRELKDRAQQMIAKLEEAEMMTQTFDRYRGEVEKKVIALEQAEATLKDQVINLQVQLEEAQEESSAAKLRNSILEKEKEEFTTKIEPMQSELETLRDVRNAYNNTLDEIEKLNGGLKEAMEGFEAKSEKLLLLETERESLINKLTDLEDAFGDLERKLEDSDKTNASLKAQLETQSRQLEESQKLTQESQHELNSFRTQQVGNDILQKEVSELSSSYEEKIRVLNEAKGKLEELLSSKANEVGMLHNHLKGMEQELQNMRQGYEARTAEMDGAFQQRLYSLQLELDALRQQPLAQPSQASPAHSAKHLPSADSMENPFGDIKDEEDGWGWTGAEGMAEGELQDARIAELTNTIQQLQADRDRSVEELEAMKLNYKKVLKKLKDMKAESEKSKAESKGGFSDLDLVLQAELRGENDALQSKMGELNKQLEGLKKEKEMLSKRVDTLTSANEQLIDMKERQDIEVQMWQKRSSELANQLQNLQRSLDGITSVNSAVNDPELALKFTELSEENEQLRAFVNTKCDEVNRALAREQDLEQEILDLKSSLGKDAAVETPMAKTDVAPVASAAVLFQGSAAAIDDVFSSFTHPSSAQSKSSAATEELIKQKSSLEAEVWRLTEEVDSLKNDNAQLQDRVQFLAQQNIDLSEKIEEVSTDGEHSHKINSLQTRVGSQKAYFDEQVRDLEQNFQKALLERDEENAHLVCSISAKEQALKNAVQELESLRESYRNVADLQAKVEEYQKDNLSLRSEIEGMRNYLDVSRESSETEHSNIIQSLRNQISVLEETNTNISGIIQNKEMELERLYQTVEDKDREMLGYKEKLQNSSREIDELKCNSEEDALNSSNVLADMDSLSKMVADLQVTINNQQDQLGDKDRIIFELQNEIRCLQSVAEAQRYEDNDRIIVELRNENQHLQTALAAKTGFEHHQDQGEEEGRLRYSVGFLEQERARLEHLVQEKLSEVAKYESEVEQLKKSLNRPSQGDIESYIASIEEKDAEINRLAKSVVEIQERLLLSEQGKLHPEMRTVQSKLDQALYTLHARDVKIEEQNVEIMQLLEERDSLQLRLSDALRRSAEPSRKEEPSQKSVINEKLSELHAGYKKDPLVQNEREVRHAQHMQLYSESPPARQDESIVDYGIFNWFFGGSPPPAPQSQVGVNEGS